MQVLQEKMSALFDRSSGFVEYRVVPRWHVSYFAFSGACFRDSCGCQCANALENLFGIEAALAGEQLPIPSPEAVTTVRASDLLSEVFSHVLPDVTTHDIVHRRERRAATTK